MSAHPFAGTIAFAEQSLEDFCKTLEAVALDLFSRIERYAAGYDLDSDERFVMNERTLARLTTMSDQVDDALARSGYAVGVSRLLLTREPLARLILKAWTEGLGIPVGFRSIDLDALRAVTDADLSKFANIGTAGVEMVKQSLRDAITGRATFDTFAARLVDAIGPDLQDAAGNSMTRYASVIATTAVSQFNRFCNWRLFEAAGIDRFLWFGGIISTTRPLCAQNDGHVFSQAELQAMSNGQTASVWPVELGGYGCRHVLVPYLAESPLSVSTTEAYAKLSDEQRAEWEKANAPTSTTEGETPA